MTSSATLSVGAATGLTTAEAARRLADTGPNEGGGEEVPMAPHPGPGTAARPTDHGVAWGRRAHARHR
ncbi:cation-transporting P-type ATPase [Streptomyces sp. NPDC021012]|uniref:cation-transporting P-type ATPase n=1 Tax=Streptomyces sp. NPDC021012 TaxID=3365107 RepID=UPI003798106F